MAALFRSISHGLALPFAPEGSQRLQEQQIREVCNRFYDLRSDRKVGGPATSSQGSEMQPIPGATTDVPNAIAAVQTEATCPPAAPNEDSVDDQGLRNFLLQRINGEIPLEAWTGAF